MRSKLALLISAAGVMTAIGCGGGGGTTTASTTATAPTPPPTPTPTLGPINYRLEGTIVDSAEPSMPDGTPYSATLTFDQSNRTASADPLGGTRYTSSSATFSFNAGSVDLSGTNISISIDTTVNGGDWMRIDGSLTGSFAANLRVNLADNSASVFNADAFSDPFPALADFSSAQLIINTSKTTLASLDVFEPAT